MPIKGRIKSFLEHQDMRNKQNTAHACTLAAKKGTRYNRAPLAYSSDFPPEENAGSIIPIS
jgi:hypothetical protein